MHTRQYSTKYNMNRRLTTLEAGSIDKLNKIVYHTVDTLSQRNQFGINYFLKQMRQHPDFTGIRNDTRLINKHMIGYSLTLHPKIEWINCGCGGTGNFRKVK